MEATAETILKAVASKIKNEYRLSRKDLNSIKAKAQVLAKESKHFSLLELECLIRQFNILIGKESKLTEDVSVMYKSEFKLILRLIFGFDTKLMIDRVFAFLNLKEGVREYSRIGVEEWIKVLGVFLRGDLDEKILHAFQVYQLTGEKGISDNDIFKLLKKDNTSKSKYDGLLDDITDITLEALANDNRWSLSYSDFQKAVHKSSLYLQAFGKCLPDEFAVAMFENHLTELKAIVTAKGERELNIPRKGCLLNMSGANSTHDPELMSPDKLSGFLVEALQIPPPPPSPRRRKARFTFTNFTNKEISLTTKATTKGKAARSSRKPM